LRPFGRGGVPIEAAIEEGSGMSSTLEPLETRAAGIGDGFELLLDERTVEILDRRRRHRTISRRGWLVRRALAMADVFGLVTGFAITTILFAGDGAGPNVVGEWLEVLVFAGSLPIWLVAANAYGLYNSDEERTDHSTADDLVGVFHLVTVGSWLLFIATMSTGLADPPLQRQMSFWIIAIVLVTTARAAARSLCRRTFAYLQNTIIVGAGDVGQLLAHKYLQHPEYGINLVGFVDANPKVQQPGLEHPRVIGRLDELPEIVRVLDIDRVVIAFSADSHGDLLDVIRSVKDLDVQVDIVPRLFELLGPSIGIHTAEGLPLLSLPPLRLSRTAKLAKRALDLALAVPGLVVLAPLLALTAAAIKLDSPGPVLFRQERRGAGESTFRILKFRTMVQDAEVRKAQVAHLNKHRNGDSKMFKIDDDPRVTRVGRIIRRYSLDELPQLLNVVRGEMSLVGPRPLILEEDRHVLEWRRRRLNLKPGITGLWQVLGRDDIPFDEMVKLDYLYVTTWSTMYDIKLILRTIPLLFRGRSS
jgi:exopolysaccharide biosynthesis polyprenyl glycosylphosphotransferase